MNAAHAEHLQVSGGASLLPAIQQWLIESGQTRVWLRGFGTLSFCALRTPQGTRDIGPAPELSLASLDVWFDSDGNAPVMRASAVIGIDAHGVHTTAAGELVEAIALDVVLACVNGGRLEDAAPRTLSANAPAGRAPASNQPTQPAKPAQVSAPAAPRDRVAATPTPSAASRPQPSRPEPAASRPQPSRPDPAASTAPSAGGADWAQVMAMSNKIQNGALDDFADDIDVDELKPNDVLIHPSLNRCLVVRVEGDDAVRVRVPNGSVRKLMMRPFRLIVTDTDRTFRIEKK